MKKIVEKTGLEPVTYVLELGFRAFIVPYFAPTYFVFLNRSTNWATFPFVTLS